jgi:hypothetical protein
MLLQELVERTATGAKLGFERKFQTFPSAGLLAAGNANRVK